MRTATAQEITDLAAPHINVHLKVEIKDSDGTWRDVSAVSGLDWLIAAKWGDNVDERGITGTIELFRGRGATSMSPLMTGSTVNRNAAAAYVPFLNVNQNLRLSAACTLPGIVVSAWREMFQGVITKISMAGLEDAKVVLDVGDLVVPIVKRQIEVVRAYGSVGGTLVESIIQSELNDNLTAPPTLYVPASPAWYLPQFAQKKGGLFDGIEALATQIGYDLRYKYDAANNYRFTFYAPARTKTISDATITPAQYQDVTALVIDSADVRNVVDVIYVDGVTGAKSVQTASNNASVATYGRQYMSITEEASSNINTAAEALTLAQRAVDDLSDPSAAESIVMLFWPLVELGDLYTLQANGDHYDTDQQRAVVSYSHEVREGHGTTTIQTRGKPVSMLSGWLELAADASTLPRLSVQVTPTGGAYLLTVDGDNLTLSIDNTAPTAVLPGTLTIPRDTVDHVYLFTASGPGGQLVYPVNIPAAFKVGPEVSYQVDPLGSVAVTVVGRAGAASTKVYVRTDGVKPTAADIKALGTTLATQTGTLTGLASVNPSTKFWIGAVSTSSQGVDSDPTWLPGSWLGANDTPLPAFTWGTPQISSKLVTVPIALSATGQRVEFFHVESPTDLSNGASSGIDIESLAADVYDWVQRASDGSYTTVMRFPLFHPGDYVFLTAVITDALGRRGAASNLKLQVPGTPPTTPTTPAVPSGVVTTSTGITANCTVPGTGVAVNRIRPYVDGSPLADVAITVSAGSAQNVSFGNSFAPGSAHQIAFTTLTSAGVESALSPVTTAVCQAATGGGGGGGTGTNGKVPTVTGLSSRYSQTTQEASISFTAPAGTPSGTRYYIVLDGSEINDGGWPGSPAIAGIQQTAVSQTRHATIIARCTGYTDSDPSAVVTILVPVRDPGQPV